mmetsp:Transcript_46835/g.114217  ORF Transcript_46835/g.114217 Transcript_46835/m.114217 type:complete len:202 (+) Transcript_46835:1574-2179(+)
MTEIGTNLAATPRRVTPDATWRPPHASVMNGNASSPCCWTAPTMRRLMAAAGPVTANVVPPISPPATPDTAAVTNPTSAGTPDATAIASDRGTAMQPTVIPAETSANKFSDDESIFFHSGTSGGIPMSIIHGLLFLRAAVAFSSSFAAATTFDFANVSSLSSSMSFVAAVAVVVVPVDLNATFVLLILMLWFIKYDLALFS